MADAEQPKPAEDLLFKGKRMDCKKVIRDCFLFDGFWKDKMGAEKERVKSKTPNLIEQVKVRRIKCEDCIDGWKDVANKLIQLNHNNILRVFGYEEDVANGWRYFALELYNATLYAYCNYMYNGPMPNESQVLYQITNGICYLHGKGIVHGDLNPLNVVISAQSRPVRMKISDFGLSKFSYNKQWSEKGVENMSSKVEVCLRKYWYWTMSEETDSLVGINDATGDVIAAACILFYYLRRGKHLFGNGPKAILINLKENNPVNLPELDETHFAYEPIKNMIIPSRKGFSWLHVANEKFKDTLSLQVTSKLLGSGTYGDVYEGKFDGDRVAVKQMTTTKTQKVTIQREMNIHIELNHVNVVKLWDVSDSADNRFTHLVLELCAGTLADYCGKKYGGPILPPDELVLYQIANGLHYIHSRNLVHRDIKPENILISMTMPVQMKVSDLSFVKKTRQDMFSQSKIRGTLQWMAPERLKFLNDRDNMPAVLPDGTIKSDTFSSGCVFFYFLTRGTHPFGKNQATVPANILLNKPEEIDSFKQNLTADDINRRILAGLIEGMIKSEEEERIGLPEVIKQLANLLYNIKDGIKCQFQPFELESMMMLSARFHPTEPILACAYEKELIFYTAESSSIPFSNWEKQVKRLPENLARNERILLEWNFNGTQLAAVGNPDGYLVIWSYPECKILIQKTARKCDKVEWSPTRPNWLAAFCTLYNQVFVIDSSIGNVITIHSGYVKAVKWISENRIAVSSFSGMILIFEMDDSNLTTTRLVKEFTHGFKIHYLEWNERMHYLASGGQNGINIWSMDHGMPIYSLKTKDFYRCAWRTFTGNGEEEGGIEMARKSAKNFTFVYASKSDGVFIWNPLESEQQPRRISINRGIETLSFSSDGRLLAAGSDEKLIIWSAEGWEREQTPTFSYDRRSEFLENVTWNYTTTATNLCDTKLIANFRNRAVVFELAFKESTISDSATQMSTESNNGDYVYDEDVDVDSEDVSPLKRLKRSFL